MSFSECVLDDDVTGAIFDFFEPEDLVSMAITCRHSRLQVESYAKMVYEKLLEAIAKSPNVDANWRRRLQEHQDRTRSRTYRHRLQCIRQVHLSTTQTRDEHTFLQLSETNVLQLNAAGTLEEWNMQTPTRLVRVFDDTHGRRELIKLYVCGNHIVSCDHLFVKVWNMEGHCLHTIPFGHAYIVSSKFIAAHEATLYYPSRNEHYWSISEIDILSGQNTRIVQQQGWSNVSVFPQQLLCCGRWLLVMFPSFEFRDKEDQGGIHVLNRTELKKESCVKGWFLCMATSDDGSCVAAATRDGAVRIMRIDNGGTLHVLHSVSFCPLDLHITVESLTVLRNKIYLLCGRVDERKQIHVIDATTGNFVGQLYYPDWVLGEVLGPRELTTDGHNVYCHFIAIHGISSDVIMAYPG